MFMVSPGVNVRETDASSIVPNVSASDAATVGSFRWGTVEEVIQVDTEDQLASIFGKPTNADFTDFMVSASFLAYATNLKVVRVVSSDARNSTATNLAATSGILVKNISQYETINWGSSTDLWVAKCAGSLGNAVGVAWCDSASFDAIDTNGNPEWIWASQFAEAPAAGEFHIVVYDATGDISGVANSMLEKFEYVSTNAGAKYFDGTSAMVKDVINRKSTWLWFGNPSLLTGVSSGVVLGGGTNGSPITGSDRTNGWELFQNVEEQDISLAFPAGADEVTSKWVIDNIAELRKDCVAFVSPMQADVVNVTADQALSGAKTTRSLYGNTSYAFMDSAWKLMYDRYNDVERWVPLNGDIAGLAARATNEQDAWWSPAGYERGRIKNCIKLSWTQKQSHRDELYKVGINPVVSFPQEGPMLFGDKTLQVKASAFDRIGTRRLFIVLEKAIATAAKYQLFNFNDAITRSKFVNMVEPFLATVQGRRGIRRGTVVCDESNNTDEVIARNEFVGTIFILPNYSINYIQLDFVAVNSVVQFDELVVRQ